jgi:hypothetical protein
VHLSGYADDSFAYSSDEEMEDEKEEEDVPTPVPAGKGKSSPLDQILATQKKKGNESESNKEVKMEIEKDLNIRKKAGLVSNEDDEGTSSLVPMGAEGGTKPKMDSTQRVTTWIANLPL